MYIFSAGGTGGHVFPAVSVAKELMPDPVLFITDQRGKKYIPQDYAYQCLNIRRNRYYLGDMVKAVFQCLSLFKKYKPGAVMGFGGYPSVPACVAAFLLRIPFAIHEQNAKIGKANIFLSYLTKHFYTSFPSKKGLHVGNPVRENILSLYKKPYEAPENIIHCLVLGGSQGARDLSLIIPHVIPIHIKIHHQARVEDVNATKEAYKRHGIEAVVQPFFDDMAAEYQWAHFVICRAGASTLAELAITKRPAILLPYFQGGQQENAKAMEHASFVCQTEEDVKNALELLLTSFQEKSELISQFAKPHAAKNLSKFLRALGSVNVSQKKFE